MSYDGKIVRLKPKKRPRVDSRTLQVVHKDYDSCKHIHLQISADDAELLCLDCGVKVNPYWYIQQLAYKEATAIENVFNLRVIAAELEKRTRFKCDHCGKMTAVRSNLSENDRRSLVSELRKADQL